MAIAPPFGLSVMDLPLRMPLPAKITIEVLPPIDVKERFGSDPERDEIYDEITDEMQERALQAPGRAHPADRRVAAAQARPATSRS